MAVTAGTAPAVAFKGRMMTLTVLEVRRNDPEAIADGLRRHLDRASGFFRGMPVLLSLGEPDVDLAALAQLLTRHELVPVAVLDGDPDAAAAAGLGVIDSERMPRERRSEPAAEEGGGERGAARLITRPVRSGQQIYARNGDLVVTSAVSEGAEVLADGHIHIYGPLRGRALAGATGDANARIFCHRFEADLVAVAGCYKVADDIDEGVRGKPVQVRLDDDNLIIEAQE